MPSCHTWGINRDQQQIFIGEHGASLTVQSASCSHVCVCVCLNGSAGDCLLDMPESSIALPRELPGIKYSLDEQCQQIFGEEFAHCPNTSVSSDACSQLWCQEDGTSQCSTKNGSLPWADGTPCSANGSCLHGECISTEEVMQPPVRKKNPCLARKSIHFEPEN